MYTQYDFPEMFRQMLSQKAESAVEHNISTLEKEMLEQHTLLTDLTSIGWKTRKRIRSLGLFIGAAEGMDNVHEAYFLSQYIKNRFKSIRTKFVTSGAIGVTLGKYKDINVPGVNGRVMGQMLYEYGVDPRNVIIEDQSLHTDMQATQMQTIINEERFDSIICIADYWHQARLMMTMIGRNPETLWFTHTVETDKDNINSALFDWGQKIFQTPLLIAEVARIHNYVEKGMGPCDLDGLCEYLSVFHPRKLRSFIKSKKLARLKYLWEKDHQEILSNFERFSKYR